MESDVPHSCQPFAQEDNQHAHCIILTLVAGHHIASPSKRIQKMSDHDHEPIKVLVMDDEMGAFLITCVVRICSTDSKMIDDVKWTAMCARILRGHVSKRKSIGKGEQPETRRGKRRKEKGKGSSVRHTQDESTGFPAAFMKVTSMILNERLCLWRGGSVAIKATQEV